MELKQICHARSPSDRNIRKRFTRCREKPKKTESAFCFILPWGAPCSALMSCLIKNDNIITGDSRYVAAIRREGEISGTKMFNPAERVGRMSCATSR